MKQNLESNHLEEEETAVVVVTLLQVVWMLHLVLPLHLHEFPQAVQYFQLAHSILALHQHPILYAQGTNAP